MMLKNPKCKNSNRLLTIRIFCLFVFPDEESLSSRLSTLGNGITDYLQPPSCQSPALNSFYCAPSVIRRSYRFFLGELTVCCAVFFAQLTTFWATLRLRAGPLHNVKKQCQPQIHKLGRLVALKRALEV